MERKLIANLKQIYYSSNNDTFRGIAKYLLNNVKETFTDYSIMKLSKQTFTSPATITRFCNELGYGGFKELHYLLKQKENEKFQDIQGDIIDLDIPETLLTFKENLINSINKTFDFNFKKFPALKEQIDKKNRIYFFGLGNNNLLMKTASHLLVRLDFNVVYSSFVDQQASYVDNFMANDIVIIVSMTLSDPFFYDLIQKLISKNVVCLFITKNKNSEILDNIDPKHIYLIENCDDTFGTGFSSEILIMFILKMLTINLIDNNNFSKIGKNYIY